MLKIVTPNVKFLPIREEPHRQQILEELNQHIL